MKKIIGLGETVYDIIFRDNQPIKAVPGGSAFNAVISVGRTGLPCMMLTEVGDDHVGDIVTDFLKRNNVTTDFVYRHEGTQSHISLAFLNERNDADYQFYKMHNAINMPEMFPEVNEGDIILFGSYFAINPKVRSVVHNFLSMAHKKGAIIYYDLNFRASHKDDIPNVMPSIIENMQLSTVVRGSSEDFSILYGCNDAEEVYEKYIKPHCTTFIYTNADLPVKVFTKQYKASFPAKKIKTVSTIGAGDNFNAGFCYGLYCGGITAPDAVTEMPAEEMGKYISKGQMFSSHVCQSLENYISEDFASKIRKESIK